MNQEPNELEEELALLRGRDDTLEPGVETSPVYNRLIWNFTQGINGGEAAYAYTYNITGNSRTPTEPSPPTTPNGSTRRATAMPGAIISAPFSITTSCWLIRISTGTPSPAPRWSATRACRWIITTNRSSPNRLPPWPEPAQRSSGHFPREVFRRSDRTLAGLSGQRHQPGLGHCRLGQPGRAGCPLQLGHS